LTRIAASDQLLILLREQLQRLGRGKSARAGRAGAAAEASPGAIERLKALAGRGGIGEEELRRTLVRAVLTEEIGDRLANEPGLQAIVDDVFRIISESEEGRGLLDRALGQVRGG
jgi:hypothetical protein